MAREVDFFTGAAAAGRVSLFLDFPDSAIGEREILDFEAILASGVWAFLEDVFWFFCDAGTGGTLRDDCLTAAGRGADLVPDRVFCPFRTGAFSRAASFGPLDCGFIFA